MGSFLFGVIFGLSMGVLKFIFLDQYMNNFLVLDLSLWQTVFLYGIIAFGALLGDIIKSIAKRMLNIPAHSARIPFDEIDHSTVSLLLASLFFPIPIKIIAIISSLFLHILANLIGYKIGIKDVPY